MQIRCPHCQNGIELVHDSDFQSVSCPSCGSDFGLVDMAQGDVETLQRDNPQNRTIGHFELLEEVGRGAFGSVWRSHDTKLDRQVAVKIPRPDQLSDSSGEQFLREARAAAQLSHPNIVTLHEVGRIDDQLYIVSDFIDGISMADLISARQLATREAVELCVTVAAALEHAHQQGVIHRDLKPSNIMLDQQQQPQVMDFGLAKREAGEITMTIEGKLLGTPAYMPPEQARGEGHHVDRRADIYSLGVILFELLTGELPFRGTTRMLIYQVIHEDAPSPRRLNNAIPRDLQTITLKCLEKDPSRRYNSCQQLADDLQAWLDHKPIQARPVGSAGRLIRWARRRSAVAALGMLAVISLLVGSFVSTATAVNSFQLREAARTAREGAGSSLKKALKSLADTQQAAKDARDARDKATAAQEDAEKTWQVARTTVADVYQATSRRLLADQPSLRSLRENILQSALEYNVQFSEQESDDPELIYLTGQAQYELAIVYSGQGTLDRAEATAKESLQRMEKLNKLDEPPREVPRRVADCLNILGTVARKKGNLKQALQYYQRAFQQFADLVQASKVPTGQDTLQVDFAGDIALVVNNIGNVQKDLDQLVQAEESLRDALTRYTQLDHGSLRVIANPSTDPAGLKIVSLFLDSPIHKTGLQKGDILLSLDGMPLRTETNLDVLLSTRPPGTEVTLVAWHDDQQVERKVELGWLEGPDAERLRAGRALASHNLGIVFRRQQKFSEARRAYQQAIQLREHLHTIDPSPAHKFSLAISYDVRGNLLATHQAESAEFASAAEAVISYTRAIELLDILYQRAPQVIEYRQSLARAYSSRGQEFLELDQYDAGLEDFNKTIEIDPQYEDIFANRGYAYLLSGNNSLAIADLSRAIEIAPQDDTVYYDRGNAYRRSGQIAEALNNYSKAIMLDPSYLPYLRQRAELFANEGQFDKAIADYSRGLELEPENVNLLANRGLTYGNQGDNLAAAVADMTKAITLAPQVAMLYTFRGQFYYEQGQFLKARTDYLIVLEKEPDNAPTLNAAAWLLATCPQETVRDGATAVKHATRACELSKYEKYELLDTLAAAHAEAGDFTQAVRWLGKALKLAPADAKPVMEQRLKLFESEKPFRETPQR
jgi:tetratricopeptide (TPR) repeat protein